jgi:hypothetical protein
MAEIVTNLPKGGNGEPRPADDLAIDIIDGDDDELRQLVDQVDDFASDLENLAAGLRNLLDRAERPDRLAVGAGYGRLDPGELELVTLAMEELASEMSGAAYLARPDDDEPAS